MTDRPTFINTAGERKRLEVSGFEADELEHRYMTAFASNFVYDNLPEGCPEDYIERMLYIVGGISGKDVSGLGPILCGALPSAWSTYGVPVRWTPQLIMSETTSGMSAELMEESDGPVLFDRVPMHMRIQPYLQVMKKAMNALNVNLVGLTNPVMIEASPGMELKGRIIANNLMAGDVYIPVIDKGAIGASVLDLKATDHTANLLGVIHDMDGEILDMMGIRSSLEKASGISVEEASASEMQVQQMGDTELLRRQKWLEALNAHLGTNITVRRAGTEDAVRPGAGDEDDEDKEDPDNAD